MNACPNRLGAELGEDHGPCGDEGRLCEPCSDAEHARWHRVYGHMSREQLEACDPRPLTDGRREELEQELRDAGRGR